MDRFAVKVDDKVEAEFANLTYALGAAVRETSNRGVDCVILNPDDGLVYYDVEADTKVDDDDLTFPAIVHVRSILVGANA